MRRLSLVILLGILMLTASSWALELTCKGKADFASTTIKLSFEDTGQPDLWGKVTVLRGEDILLEDDNAVMGEFKIIQVRGKLRDTGEQAFLKLTLDSGLKTVEAVIFTQSSAGENPLGSYTCQPRQPIQP